MPVKLLIDSDCGIDDANAIALACTQPLDRLEILAITTVQGNCEPNQAARNTCRVLKATNRTDIPVYVGAEKPIGNSGVDLQSSDDYHGKDGLGDVPHLEPTFDTELDGHMIKEGIAAMELIRFSKTFPGEITLACLGPLTNVALALRLDGGFANRLKSIYFLGGNIRGVGNVTHAAEYNFYRDPEAAAIVFGEMKCEIVGIPWEVFMDHPIQLDWYKAWLGEHCNETGQFLAKINAFGIRALQSADMTFAFCDEMVIAAILNSDEFILESEHCTAMVELNGTHTRGQVVIHRIMIQDSKKKETNVKFVSKINVDFIQKLAMESVEK